MTGLIIDAFAGPGGWSEGLRKLNLRDVGLEWCPAACATRAAAGHATIRCDVAAYPVEPFIGKTTGYIASPPCTLFSEGGTRIGRLALDILAVGVRRMMRGEDCRAEIRERVYAVALEAQEQRNAKRPDAKRWDRARVEAAAREDAFVACLVLEPARYLHALITADGGVRLEWAAFEQVPSVLPLWQVYAGELRRFGWSVWCGVLCAADYGVGQARHRAILIASAVRKVRPPAPTHTKEPVGASLFGDPLPGWVSMADTLGWGATDRPSPTVTAGGAKSGGVEPFARASRESLNQAQHRGAWVRNPAAGRHIGPDTIRITVTEAGLLQSFPADYPWQGSRNKQHEQAGNAVPPLLAAHVVAAAAGLPAPRAGVEGVAA